MATNNIPLYTQSKLTRKQAINEIANVILHSNMKPRIVEYALQLLQKFLPVDNTLPTTIDELFDAMMSSENDWRLAQYLIKHKQNPSLTNMRNNENTPILVPSSKFIIFNSNESSSSSSDDENELSPYDRLQEYLRPITNISSSNIISNNQLRLNSIKRLLDETSSNHEQNLFYQSRIFISDLENKTSNNKNKLCCFEINGHDLLNDGK